MINGSLSAQRPFQPSSGAVAAGAASALNRWSSTSPSASTNSRVPSRRESQSAASSEESDKPPVAKETHLDELMTTIRERATSLRSWLELSKLTNKMLTDRQRVASLSDGLSGGSSSKLLQRCLDTIQKRVEIKSLHSMAERLEALTRTLSGLKFHHTGSGQCFISSDMFYVEIGLDTNDGRVVDVKVAHHNEPVSCPELTRVLSNGEFNEFSRHLEGLNAIYAIGGEKKSKPLAFVALSALETDLSQLAQLQR